MQNILDVLFLRGVDMCMTETDYFDYFKALDTDLYADICSKIKYIAKLYNTEFHILARKDVTSLDQLRGKKVNFYTRLNSADISGRRSVQAARHRGRGAQSRSARGQG